MFSNRIKEKIRLAHGYLGVMQMYLRKKKLRSDQEPVQMIFTSQ
jgi:hypothetical protein